MKKTIAIAALVVTCAVGRAIADGIPTVTPLTYSGVLQNTSGASITTSQSIQLTLWDDVSANASTNQKCVTPTQSVQPDTQGRFQIVLDQACFDAVRANPDLWIQLQIGAAVLPRTKIGAVPYALESGRSSRSIVSYAGRSTTTFGLYCGATAATTGSVSANAGALIGFSATKFLCEQTCSSATAHFCTGAEASASYELEIPLPRGWVKSGTSARWTVDGTATPVQDCRGFNSTAASEGGLYWVEDAHFVGQAGCGNSFPLLCCN